MSSLSQALVEMVAEFEGFSAQLYNDPANHATIGFGHLVHLGPINGSEPGHFQQGITREQAFDLLRNDLTNAERIIEEQVNVPLKAHQYEALVSFAFNIGRGHFADSALRIRLNNDEYESVPEEMRRWVFAKGSPKAGLIRRRQREGTLFARGIYHVIKPGEYINQEMINAFARAETKLGLPLWTLLRRTGMTPEGLAEERRSLYKGLPVDRLPNLTEEERQAIKAELPDAIAPFDGGGNRNWGDFLWQVQTVAEAQLQPPMTIAAPTGAEPLVGRVVRAWNLYGGLLTAIADELGLDPKLAVGVLACAKGKVGQPTIPTSLYGALGYESEAEMGTTLASDPRFPIIALFDWIAGAKGKSREVQALRIRDWNTFAALHYGIDRAAKQAHRLADAVEWFETLLQITEEG